MAATFLEIFYSGNLRIHLLTCTCGKNGIISRKFFVTIHEYNISCIMISLLRTHGRCILCDFVGAPCVCLSSEGSLSLIFYLFTYCSVSDTPVCMYITVVYSIHVHYCSVSDTPVYIIQYCLIYLYTCTVLQCI